MLQNKTIVLGITGGIAAYKAAEVVSGLKKLGADVKVIMTKSAAEFITPLTFMSLSQSPVYTEMFSAPAAWETQHISLAKAADVFAVLPCTANVIGKIANGIADDMLTTTVMATKAPVLIAPAMNTNMYENPIVQENIEKLKSLGYSFVAPACGRLACGDTGKGKLAAPEEILDEIIRLALLSQRDLCGKKVLVTAGATQESIDPVRYITNHSSGKMGYAIAKAAMLRGADVTLITGPTHLSLPAHVHVLPVVSAREMYQTVITHAEEMDIIIKAAAVADFTPAQTAKQKIKKNSKESTSLLLEGTQDILKELGRLYGGSGKKIIGFCMETEHLMDNAKKKCTEKNADIIVANDLSQSGAGFGGDTNIVTFVLRDGTIIPKAKMSKFEVANALLDQVVKL